MQKLLPVLLVIGFILACNEHLVKEEAINKVELKSAKESVSQISQIVKEKYIVVFKKHVTNPKAEADGLTDNFGITTSHK